VAPETAEATPTPRAVLPDRPVFVVWSPREKGTRSAWMADAIGIDELHYIAPTRRRGMRAAAAKYPRQVVATLWLLARKRPRVVFVQTPPSFASWVVALYASLSGAIFVVDSHSDAFERSIWTRPAWLNRWVARRAATTITTNEHWAGSLRAWEASAVVVPSVPAQLEVGDPPPLPDGFNVAVVNTWGFDEPVAEVLEAAAELPETTFHVTGRIDRAVAYADRTPPNVRFTGFLSERTYNALLANSDAVMCLTTRDHTMQNGACEAMALGTPIVTSDWPILREYFDEGTVHVDNTGPGIAKGMRTLIAEHPRFRAEVAALRERRQREWEETRRRVIEIVTDRLGSGRRPKARIPRSVEADGP
jgi:glycosyltransferase involved in cell wall biosynthesis